MPFLFICLFTISIICLIVGLRKSSFKLVRKLAHDPEQYCAMCGWTKEKVQLCQFEQHQQAMVAPLCFDCCIKHDALPIRGSAVGSLRPTQA
jgi:hypothetical protein